MLQASLMSGLAISITRTALAHSISYPITARYRMPHGLACGFTLPAILGFNAQADDGRLAEMARRLGFTSVQDLQKHLTQLLTLLEVDMAVKNYVCSLEDLLELAPEMLAPGRADNNLRLAEIDDVREILRAALSF